MITIEKGIPRPGNQITEALKVLEIGDSFLVPKEYRRSTPYSFARYLGIKVSVRKDIKGQLRLWRIE